MGGRKGGVAFFDSGIGGLTVVDACRKWLPNKLFYYYGDNKHAPYGNLSPNTIKKYVFRIFKRFEKMKVDVAVVACNTVTAVCIEDLRARFSFPIIGIEPAVLPAASCCGEVYVLTTRRTYESRRFRKLCSRAEKLFPETKISLFPCDHLAGLIERNIFEKGFDYTPYLPKGNPDAVVLGCTHYGYLMDQLKGFYRAPIFDGNQGVARQLMRVLFDENVFSEHLQPPDNHFQPFEAKSGQNRRKKRGGGGTRAGVFQGVHLFSKVRRKDGENSNKNRTNGGIIFLGKGKKYNKAVYEHLFL